MQRQTPEKLAPNALEDGHLVDFRFNV